MGSVCDGRTSRQTIKSIPALGITKMYLKPLKHSCETIQTRHRASTSMYSLTFHVRFTTTPQYGRNGTANAAGASMLSPARGVFAGMRSVRVRSMRAVGLADYRWALPRISTVLP